MCSPMFREVIIMCLLFFLLFFFFPTSMVSLSIDPTGGEFSFNGYLDTAGIAGLSSDGLFILTNATRQRVGQIFYKFPIQFKNSENGTAFSFSTTFVFAIVPELKTSGASGIAFAISPTTRLTNALGNQYLGLFNHTSNGNSSNHIVAVELATILSPEFGDINDNHIGIDINGLISKQSSSAGYFDDEGIFKNLSLISGNPMQVWIEYNSSRKQLNVTIHPLHVKKPKRPLLSLGQDLSSCLYKFMYLGFTSSTGPLFSLHYILGWTFKVNGTAPDIDPSRLPRIPRDDHGRTQNLWKTLAISLSLSAITILLVLILSFLFILKRKKLMEVIEDWEVQYRPQRFSYKDLFVATKGFRESELLGKGGFGKVYRGTLPLSNIKIAVKKVSHDSRQGMREFVAEIATIGHLRHPNLVRLLGYCRRKGEFYLVYDFMPNGSLDKFLYQQTNLNLDWPQRFNIIKDVASGLFFLHQQWVQVIIHRDIKPANILIDENMNAKLGDFGLAKLCDHGIDPQTSHVAGTLGYISPELSRTGKASTSSDVFAFGVFMLEITCGKRPVEPGAFSEEMVLVDWVLECYNDGDILQSVDSRLGDMYVPEQVTLVLKLGLLCSHPVAAARPNMSSVIQFLGGVAQLPPDMLDIVEARESNGGSNTSGELAADSLAANSVPTLTFTESFICHGR